MLIINGKYQPETPVIVHNVKPQKPPKMREKPVIEFKPAEPIKQEAKAMEPEEPKKGKAKKRPVHGVETRHRTRR